MCGTCVGHTAGRRRYGRRRPDRRKTRGTAYTRNGCMWSLRLLDLKGARGGEGRYKFLERGAKGCKRTPARPRMGRLGDVANRPHYVSQLHVTPQHNTGGWPRAFGRIIARGYPDLGHYGCHRWGPGGAPLYNRPSRARARRATFWQRGGASTQSNRRRSLEG